MYVLKNLAIQLDNSSTYEVFEIFELNNLQTTTEKEMKDLVNQIAEEVVKYNKDILKYYKG
jgi:flagellar biosynthesis/type III secretory pathway protein FliH